jgi:hypothetical protein
MLEIRSMRYMYMGKRLTPQNRVLLKKGTVTLLVKKYRIIYT